MSADENIIQQQGAEPCFEKQIAVIGFSCATMGTLEKPGQGFTPKEDRAPSRRLPGCDPASSRTRRPRGARALQRLPSLPASSFRAK